MQNAFFCAKLYVSMKDYRLKQFIYASEANILGIISNSLVHRTPKNATLRLVKAEILRISGKLQLSRLEANRLWLDSYAMYEKVSKKTFSTLRKIGYKDQKEVGYAETLSQRQNATYNAVHKLIVYPGKLEKMKNELSRSVEFKTKHDELFHPVTGLIAEARSESDYSPFFLCDQHRNCAKDHEDSEGKMFYDADWESYVSDLSRAKQIKKYIQQHKLQTVQYITGPPTYLVLRRNCRHQLHNIPLNAVFSLSAKEIVKKRNLYIPEGKPMTYERIQYVKYYDRLKVLVSLQSITDCSELAKDIKNTRKLARIWADKAYRAR